MSRSESTSVSLTEPLTKLSPLGEPSSRKARCACCTRSCVKRSAIIGTVFLGVLVGLCYGTYKITHEVDRSHWAHDPQPAMGCGDQNSTLALNGTCYYGFREAKLGSVSAKFEYAIRFVPNDTAAPIHFQDGAALSQGAMYICNQVQGQQACGPFNCTNDYAYDVGTCRLGNKLSSCQSKVQTDCTDMEIKWIAYNSASDNIHMEFASHFPGAGGLVILSPRPTCPIHCPEADAHP